MEYITLLGGNVGQMALNGLNKSYHYFMNNPIVPIMVIIGTLGVIWLILRA